MHTVNEFQNILNKDPQILRTGSATGVFHMAHFPQEIMEFSVCWEVASATSGLIQLERLTGTTAPGSGDAILSTTINTGSTANVVYFGNFAIGSVRQLDTGNRLGLRYVSGTVSPLGFNAEASIKPLGKGHYAIHGTARNL